MVPGAAAAGGVVSEFIYFEHRGGCPSLAELFERRQVEKGLMWLRGFPDMDRPSGMTSLFTPRSKAGR
jgi:hypothetical protein